MADYYIAFNTKEMAPNIRATKVTLKHELITDMNKEMSVALRDDPLYPELERYVLANLKGKK